jgi:hypothetical protein
VRSTPATGPPARVTQTTGADDAVAGDPAIMAV